MFGDTSLFVSAFSVVNHGLYLFIEIHAYHITFSVGIEVLNTPELPGAICHRTRLLMQSCFLAIW
jgi:hypothetical protein